MFDEEDEELPTLLLDPDEEELLLLLLPLEIELEDDEGALEDDDGFGDELTDLPEELLLLLPTDPLEGFLVGAIVVGRVELEGAVEMRLPSPEELLIGLDTVFPGCVDVGLGLSVAG